MTAADALPVRRAPPPRPRLIAALRILLPTIAALTAVTVLATAAGNAFRSAAASRAAAAGPIELVGPRLTGADDRQRPFLITADTAVRENDSLRVRLNRPVLARLEGEDGGLKVTAASGVYDEATGQLQLSGGVTVTGPGGAFSSPIATYDTRKGEMVGLRGVQVTTSAGEIQAGSVQAREGGRSVIYKGGVRTRLETK